jgi:hypothetical protein
MTWVGLAVAAALVLYLAGLAALPGALLMSAAAAGWLQFGLLALDVLELNLALDREFGAAG